MKLNKKGVTMVEVIVSVALISIVLIFLMGLFIKMRGVYNQSKIKADYEMINGLIIKAVGEDIENYGLKSVKYKDSNKKDALIFTFNEFRPTQLSSRIQKVLKVYFKNNTYYISYTYEADITPNITSAERVTGVIREIPDDVIIDPTNYISLTNKGSINKIKVPLSDSKGNIYDINIYGISE